MRGLFRKYALLSISMLLAFGCMPVYASEIENNEQSALVTEVDNSIIDEETVESEVENINQNQNSAMSLDDVISQNKESQVVTPTPSVNNNVVENNVVEETSDENVTAMQEKGYVSADSFINSMKGATDLTVVSEENQKVVSKVNNVVSKYVSMAVQIISYATIALLSLRVVLDLLFIAIPFARSFMSNGHQGMTQVSPVGQNNMFSGQGGQAGRFNMAGHTQQAPAPVQQSNPRMQWVSTAALNAVASDGQLDANGRQKNPFKIYAKDMVVVLVLVPILLVLTISGVLTNLGFLLGDVICNLIASFGNML